MVQNGCSFHGLRSEDPNQHLKDFLKLVDSLDVDFANRERTRLHLFQCSLRDQARNWIEHLPSGSISTWEDLTTHFLAQFFPSGRTVKLQDEAKEKGSVKFGTTECMNHEMTVEAEREVESEEEFEEEAEEETKEEQEDNPEYFDTFLTMK
ncbi:zinc finger, CCHC-type containing protein [Tanacetum coccineum]